MPKKQTSPTSQEKTPILAGEESFDRFGESLDSVAITHSPLSPAQALSPFLYKSGTPHAIYYMAKKPLTTAQSFYEQALAVQDELSRRLEEDPYLTTVKFFPASPADQQREREMQALAKQALPLLANHRTANDQASLAAIHSRLAQLHREDAKANTGKPEALVINLLLDASNAGHEEALILLDRLTATHPNYSLHNPLIRQAVKDRRYSEKEIQNLIDKSNVYLSISSPEEKMLRHYFTPLFASNKFVNFTYKQGTPHETLVRLQEHPATAQEFYELACLALHQKNPHASYIINLLLDAQQAGHPGARALLNKLIITHPACSPNLPYIQWVFESRGYSDKAIADLQEKSKAYHIEVEPLRDRFRVYTGPAVAQNNAQIDIDRSFSRAAMPFVYEAENPAKTVVVFLRKKPKSGQDFYNLALAIHDGSLAVRENLGAISPLEFPGADEKHHAFKIKMEQDKTTQDLLQLMARKATPEKIAPLQERLRKLAQEEAELHAGKQEAFVVNLLLDAALVKHTEALEFLAELVITNPDYSPHLPLIRQALEKQSSFLLDEFQKLLDAETEVTASSRSPRASDEHAQSRTETTGLQRTGHTQALRQPSPFTVLSPSFASNPHILHSAARAAETTRRQAQMRDYEETRSSIPTLGGKNELFP